MASLVDIVFVVSEKATMTNDHVWLKGMIHTLNEKLSSNGISPQYGLVVFGGGSPDLAHKILMNGNDFGNAGEFSSAMEEIVRGNGPQDSYSAIELAIQHYGFRATAVKAIILAADYDRDDLGGPTRSQILQSLNNDNFTLYCLSSLLLKSTSGDNALGIGYKGDSFDPSGDSYITSSVDIGTACENYPGDSLDCCTDYADLVWGTDGSAWNISVESVHSASFLEAFTTEISNDMVEDLCSGTISPSEISFYLSPNLTGEKSSIISFDYDYEAGTTIHFRITFYNDSLRGSVVYSSLSMLDPKRWFINGDVLSPLDEDGIIRDTSSTVEIFYVPEFLPQGMREEQWVNQLIKSQEKALLCGVDYYAYIEVFNVKNYIFTPVTFRKINIPCSQVEMREWREDPDKRYWISSGQGKMDLKVASNPVQSLMPDIASNEFGHFDISWQGRREDGESIYSALWDSDTDVLVSSGQGYYDRLCPVKGSRPKAITDHKQNFYILGNAENDIFVCKCIMPTEVSGTVPETIAPPTTYLCYPGYGSLLETLMTDVKMRVYDEDITGSYIISKNEVVSVIGKQDIRIDVASAFGAYAIKLRNSDDSDWSDWISIDRDLDTVATPGLDTQHSAYFVEENRFLVNWTLPKINGIRRVCCQILTFFGVTQTFCLNIFVNMNVLGYYVEYYHDENLTTPFVSNRGYFIVSEKKDVNGIPESFGQEIYIPTDIYIKVIFSEDQIYATGDLKFNMVQQGLSDQYENVLTRIDSRTYKGSFKVYKNDGIFNKDGLAFIDIYFPDDVINAGATCLSDETDKYNLMIGPKDILRYTDLDPEDIFREYKESKILKDLDINEFKQFYKRDDESSVFGNPDLFIKSAVSKKDSSNILDKPSPESFEND